MAHVCSLQRDAVSPSHASSATHVGGGLQFEDPRVWIFSPQTERRQDPPLTHTHTHANKHMREHACRKYGPGGESSAASQDGATCLQSYIITYAASKKKKNYLRHYTAIFQSDWSRSRWRKKKYEAHLEQFAPPRHPLAACLPPARPLAER